MTVIMPQGSRDGVHMIETEPAISVVPANEVSWEDLRMVFGTRGEAARCQCQRYKLLPRESFASFPAEERAHRLRQQTDCGHPESGATSGLVAYLNGEPVGWCAVEPRPAYAGLLRSYRVPWEGRTEDKNDDSVWAVTCFLDPRRLSEARRQPGTSNRRRGLCSSALRSSHRGLSDHYQGGHR